MLLENTPRQPMKKVKLCVPQSTSMRIIFFFNGVVSTSCPNNIFFYYYHYYYFCVYRLAECLHPLNFSFALARHHHPHF